MLEPEGELVNETRMELVTSQVMELVMELVTSPVMEPVMELARLPLEEDKARADSDMLRGRLTDDV